LKNWKKIFKGNWIGIQTMSTIRTTTWWIKKWFGNEEKRFFSFYL